MDRKNRLIEEAVAILQENGDEARIRQDLEMIASIFGLEAIRQRIEDAKKKRLIVE